MASLSTSTDSLQDLSAVDEELRRDVDSLRLLLGGVADEQSYSGAQESVGGYSSVGSDGHRATLPSRPGSCPNPTALTLCELENLLLLNQALQVRFSCFLSDIDKALENNQKKQRHMEAMLNQPKKKNKPILTLSSFVGKSTYFTDSKKKSPPLTAEMEKEVKAMTNYVYRTGRRWRALDEQKMVKGLRQHMIDIASHALQEHVSAQNVSADDSEVMEQMIKDKLEEYSALPDDHLLMDTREVDWTELAFETFEDKHDGVDCRLHWENHLACPISHAPWTKEEDKRLLRIANTHGYRDWIAIANELGTSRKPVDCLSRYQQELNSSLLKSSWSREDDQALRDAVSRYGSNNWASVANYLGDRRTGQQCLTRWVYSLNPAIRKGRWTQEEDQQLKAAVETVGAGRWSKVAVLVPGRTSVQCRERWVNVLDQALNRQPWTQEEDSALIAFCKEYTGAISWAEVAAKMESGRTDAMCQRRWRHLSSGEELLTHYQSRLLGVGLRGTGRGRGGAVGRGRGRRTSDPLLTKDLEEDLISDVTKEKLKKCEEMAKKKSENMRKRAASADGCGARRNRKRRKVTLSSATPSNSNAHGNAQETTAILNTPTDLNTPTTADQNTPTTTCVQSTPTTVLNTPIGPNTPTCTTVLNTPTTTAVQDIPTTTAVLNTPTTTAVLNTPTTTAVLNTPTTTAVQDIPSQNTSNTRVLRRKRKKNPAQNMNAISPPKTSHTSSTTDTQQSLALRSRGGRKRNQSSDTHSSPPGLTTPTSTVQLQAAALATPTTAVVQTPSLTTPTTVQTPSLTTPTTVQTSSVATPTTVQAPSMATPTAVQTPSMATPTTVQAPSSVATPVATTSLTAEDYFKFSTPARRLNYLLSKMSSSGSLQHLVVEEIEIPDPMVCWVENPFYDQQAGGSNFT